MTTQTSSRTLPTKINLLAPVNSLGYGGVGLNMALSLDQLCEVSFWPIGTPDVPMRHLAALQQMNKRTETYDGYAPSLRIYHQFSLAEHVGKGLHAGFPIFELTDFTEVEKNHLSYQDIIFVTSKWAAKVLDDNGIPMNRVRIAPLGVDHTIFYPSDEYNNGPTTFLNMGKWEVRKGHDFLIEAFENAFTAKDDVRLIMHCYNPCLPTQQQAIEYNQKWESRYLSSPLRDKIIVTKNRLEIQEQVCDLMRKADCGIFPARAEGWNMELAEMLALGKTCIATDYSAHTEYASGFAYMIEVDDLEPAWDGVWFRGQGRWASLGDRQMEQTVEYMRYVHKKKMSGQCLYNSGGANQMAKFTWKETARKVLEGVC